MKHLTIITLILISIAGKSQDMLKVYAYNVSFGTLIGTVGAMINKNDNDTYLQAAKKGACGGFIGGNFIFLGKKSTGLIARNQNLSYGWVSKFIHSFGVSIIENSSSGIGYFDKFNTHFGFGRFEYDIKNKDFKARIMPFSAGSFVFFCVISDFDFKKTILSGNPFFNYSFHENKRGAANFNNIMLYQFPDWTNLTKEFVFAHELLHTFQYVEYAGFNTFYNFKSKIFHLDVPYNTVHMLYSYERRWTEKEVRILTNQIRK